MNIYKKRLFLSFSLILLNACSAWSVNPVIDAKVPAKILPEKKEQPSNNHVTNDNAISSEHKPSKTEVGLNRCIFESSQLLKMNKNKYRYLVAKLYNEVDAAKYYATIVNNLNEVNINTLTPMYQYKVNDACNSISQAILAELKKGGSVKIEERK